MVGLLDKMVDLAGEYLRPALILLCATVVFNLPIVLYKLNLLKNTILYLLFCNDKKWKKPVDPNSIFGPHIAAGKVVVRKTVYFVRYGPCRLHSTSNWDIDQIAGDKDSNASV
jgi:hypothetical protein